MAALESIKRPITEDIKLYEEFLNSTLRSDIPFVKVILDYIIANRGKGIRPILVLLSAHIHSSTETIGKRSYLASMLVEMIHMASLIHDDVIDEAQVRHGHQSVNSRWGSKTSVLAGDLVLSETFACGMSSGQYDLINYICRGITSLCEGELIQSDYTSRLDITRERYLDIIFRKTATLLGISTGVGAMSSGANSREVGIARQVGINLGMAFQIKDDILDYAPEGQTGKPSCADLKERKITLPLLSVLENSSEARRSEIKSLIEGISDDNNNIDKLTEIVVTERGMELAEEVMHDYIRSAHNIISTYKPSPYRDSFSELCDFIGERKK